MQMLRPTLLLLRFLLETRFVAAKRLDRLISKPVKRLKLTTPLIENTPLQSDIERALTSERRGVRILWAPEGCGKTTHALHVCANLVENNKLSGVLYLPATATATDSTSTPLAWLREAVSDGLPGNIIQDVTSFAKLLSHHETNDKILPTPVAIVIDQVENLRRTGEMNKLIKSLAEQSVLTKTFVILVITKDPSYAMGLVEFNGRTKICFVGNAANYKWTEKQVFRWLNEKNMRGGKVSESLKAAACVAGTPGFLMDNSEEQKLSVIQEAAEYSAQLWENGLKIVRKYEHNGHN